MTEEEKKENEPRSAPGSGIGEPVHPSERPEEYGDDEGDAVQEIPIGMPINAEEFRRLKARAERASREQEEATADEDITSQED